MCSKKDVLVNARIALVNGASVKTVVKQLNENGIELYVRNEINMSFNFQGDPLMSKLEGYNVTRSELVCLIDYPFQEVSINR